MNKFRAQIDTVVLASSNQGKLKEIRDLLSGFDLKIIPQSDFDVPDAIEDGLSFVENALIKARHACRLTSHPSIADDSGLEVDCLLGEPGIYSARYAGPDASDAANMNKLLVAMQDVPNAERSARFRCVMVFMRHEHDSSPLIAQGTWDGIITQSPKGENGFGYDPVFYVPQHQCTSAQLEPQEKNAISHRGQALTSLAQKMMS